MKRHNRCGFVILSMMWLILLVFCPSVCAFAETSELSNGDLKGITLSITVPPAVTAGSGADYCKGVTKGLTFTTDDTIDNLLCVLIDETAIAPENYTVSGESLTVTLHTDYLETLSAGEHKISIATVNGYASAPFAIMGGELPNTGVNNPFLLWTILVTICAAVYVTVVFMRIRRGEIPEK